jgi:choline dehydrogenase-like flavoprotein
MHGATDAYDCDCLIVGPGFGGSVSACRLTEKGYDVVVLERGGAGRPRTCRARTGRSGTTSGGQASGCAGSSIAPCSGTC